MDKAIVVETLYKQDELSISKICKHAGIARSTYESEESNLLIRNFFNKDKPFKFFADI